MKQYTKVLFTFLVISLLVATPATALEEETVKKLVDSGKKLNEYIERYKNADLDKYNQAVVTIKDTEGNPVDCTVRLYYNDYLQEKFSTSGGSFNSVFNHGKTFPTGLLSLYLGGCECWPVEMKMTGPTFPYINEHLERVKKIIEEDVEEAVTEKASEWAKEEAEKGLGKVMEGLGMSAKAAGSFMAGFSIGAELGAPINDYIMQKVQEIFNALKAEAKDWNEYAETNAPKRPNINIIKEEWKDWGWRKSTGGAWHDPFTKFTYDITVKCRDGFEPNYYTDSHWKTPESLKPAPEITKEVEPKQTGSATSSGGSSTGDTGGTTTTPAPSEPTTPPQPKSESLKAAPPPEPDCSICDPILDEIARAQGELEKTTDEASQRAAQLDALNDAIPKAEEQVTDAEQKLDDFNNPQSSASSGDRTVTSTDLEVRRQAMSEAWAKYKSGEWNAGELENYWEEFSYDDLKELTEKARERLERDVAEAKAKVKELGERRDAKEGVLDQLTSRMHNIESRIDSLRAAYDECLERCKAGEEVDVVTAYGVGVDYDVDDDDTEVVVRVDPYDVDDDETEAGDSNPLDTGDDETESGEDVDTMPDGEETGEGYDVDDDETESGDDVTDYDVDDDETEAGDSDPLDTGDDETESGEDVDTMPDGEETGEGYDVDDDETESGDDVTDYDVDDDETESASPNDHYDVDDDETETESDSGFWSWLVGWVTEALGFDDETEAGDDSAYDVDDDETEVATPGSEYDVDDDETEAGDDSAYDVDDDETESANPDDVYDVDDDETEAENPDDRYDVDDDETDSEMASDEYDVDDEETESGEEGDDISFSGCISPGMTLDACEAGCDDGECAYYTTAMNDDKCYKCEPFKCPSGTIKGLNACEQSCSDGECELSTSKGSVECYNCDFNCEKACENRGYSASQVDHTAYVESVLDQYECVTSATIQLPDNLMVNDCFCYGTDDPSVSVDETTPQCDTACGPVDCNDETECSDGETTIVAGCVWGGWEKLGLYQYRPYFI